MTPTAKLWLLLPLLFVSINQLANAENLPASSSGTEITELRVVASIKPLALIAQDLLADLGSVEVLVKGAASPHDYALKVSDMRSLSGADLFIWMGPELERFLQKPLAGMAAERVLALGQNQGDAESKDSDDDHDHDSEQDLHRWLDPALAQAMASAIAKRLEQLYPGDSALIERRLGQQLERYRQLNQELERVLTPVKSVGFVVQHRGYDFFVRAYGLNQVAWISHNPEQPPGVRHLYDLEKALRARPSGEKASCLFVEQSHQSATARNLADQLQLRLGALDILGVSSGSYPELMRRLAGDFVACLSAAQ